jgi:hypothetical protein
MASKSLGRRWLRVFFDGAMVAIFLGIGPSKLLSQG